MALAGPFECGIFTEKAADKEGIPKRGSLDKKRLLKIPKRGTLVFTALASVCISRVALCTLAVGDRP